MKIHIVNSRFMRWVIFLLVISFMGFLFLIITFTIWIKSDINTTCREFQKQYEGDRVEVLISVLVNEKESLHNKNRAIWVLEFIGDKRALPTLKNLLNNKPCNHSAYVCQRGLKRAIDYIEGNKVSFFFKRGG